MRQLKLTKKPYPDTPEGMRHHVEQNEALLSLWMALDSTSLSTEGVAFQQLIGESARFVISLTNQFYGQGVSRETLVTAAHSALIAHLNRYAHRPDKLDKFFAFTLRSAMAAAVQAQAGGLR